MSSEGVLFIRYSHAELVSLKCHTSFVCTIMTSLFGKLAKEVAASHWEAQAHCNSTDAHPNVNTGLPSVERVLDAM